MNNKGHVAIMQIMVLLIATIAFAWSIGVVNAQERGGDGDAAVTLAASQLPRGGGRGRGSWHEGLFDYTPGGTPEHQLHQRWNDFRGQRGYDEYIRLTTRADNPLSSADAINQIRTENIPTGVEIDPADYAEGGVFEGTEPPPTEAPLDASFEGPPSQADPGAQARVRQGGFVDGFVSALSWGVTAYTTAKMLGPMFGLDAAETDAYAKALGWGFFAGRGAANWAASAGPDSWAGRHSGAIGAGVGLLVAYWQYHENYREVSYKAMVFTCKPYKAEDGGDRCNECNNRGDLPCSEYQCRSLGSACEIANPGTEQEACIHLDRNDVNPPIITPNVHDLNQYYSYNPIGISPMNRTVEIVYNGTDENGNEPSLTGCVPAYTALKFGVYLDELGYCRIDTERRQNFSEFRYDVGQSSLLSINHTHVLAPPRSANATDVEIENGINMSLFLKCQDANGNVNEGDFEVRFCVEQGPDYTAPIIRGTSIDNNRPVRYQIDSDQVIFYIAGEESVECKWSRQDKEFEDMEENMSCGAVKVPFNLEPVLPCTANLTGIKDREENSFYVRCKDQLGKAEGDRNAMEESYLYTLFGTQPLAIDEAGPDDETVRDSTEDVVVTLEAATSAGYKDGESVCFYSIAEEDENDLYYNEFFNTRSYIHTTDILRTEGDYEYLIKCVDLGGNVDTVQINFSVESDADAPVVVRAFKDGNNLKLITDEDAECTYTTNTCSFQYEDGTPALSEASEHYIEWSTTSNYYIKCQDEFGNLPDAADECSIIVKPI